ncbi:MBL fold metallo-hydrolase [Caldiplasma sukawensis]
MNLKIDKYDVPINIRALKTASIYLVKGEKTTLIDSGMGEDTIKYLSEHSVNLSEIDRVFLTHLHIDHTGGIGYMQKMRTIDCYLGEEDLKIVRKISEDTKGYLKEYRQYLVKLGFSKSAIDELGVNDGFFSGFDIYRQMEFKRLPEKDIDIEIISTPGHTPGHNCFYEKSDEVLFSGDHILERITPNISFYDDHTDMLGLYIKSLEKIKKVDTKFIMPGHGKAFSGLQERVNEILDHHEKRMREIKNIIKMNGPITPYICAEKMTWSRGRKISEMTTTEKNFAIGEALSHLRHMENEGQLRCITSDEIIKYAIPD